MAYGYFRQAMRPVKECGLRNIQWAQLLRIKIYKYKFGELFYEYVFFASKCW